MSMDHVEGMDDVYSLCLSRFLYLAAAAGAVVYLAVEVAPHHPNNLMSLAGITVLLLVSLLLSTHPERVSQWSAICFQQPPLITSFSWIALSVSSRWHNSVWKYP